MLNNIKVLFILFSFFMVVEVKASLQIKLEQLYLSRLPPATEFNVKFSEVGSSDGFYKAIEAANQNRIKYIKLLPGKYFLPKTISVTTDDLVIQGAGKSPFDVVLTGSGMKPSNTVRSLFRVSGNNFHLEQVTLEQAGNHLVQIASEIGGDTPTFKNVVFQDSYEQLLKVSYNKSTPEKFSFGGLVDNCLFRYTKGIGPNWYIGGIDAHGVKSWLIQNSIFDSIASPGKHIAEHAIHLWNATENNVVANNLIVNSDRGIGFGMRNKKLSELGYSNKGGKIIHNYIYHGKNNHPYADVGIILEDSPNTKVIENVIYMEHSYPNAIEVRFNTSKNVLVENNITNRKIKNRSWAWANFKSNQYYSPTKLRTYFRNKLQFELFN